MQVHEKEDVELDVLNLKDKEVADGQDQGHIIDPGAEKPDKNVKQGRKAKALATPPSAGQHRGFINGRIPNFLSYDQGALGTGALSFGWHSRAPHCCLCQWKSCDVGDAAKE